MTTPYCIKYDEIIFNNDFDSVLDPYFDIISKYSKLTLKYCFNQSVDNLPNTITHLTLGGCFNKSVDNLPYSLTHLTLGGNFNGSLDYLPNSLTYLKIGNYYPRKGMQYFNQSVDNLPPNLTHLILGGVFNKLIDNLPHSLVYLEIDYMFNQTIRHIPNNLKTIRLPCNKPCPRKVDLEKLGFTFTYHNESNLYRR
jgi:hypothetical protein